MQTLVESVCAMFRVLRRYPIRHCGDVLFYPIVEIGYL